MADTIRGDFGDVPCSDCGTRGSVYLKHWGPLVPPGTTGFFDGPCIQARDEENHRGIPPRPLGTRNAAGERVWTKEELLKLWPQARGELKGFQRHLEVRAGITAAQVSMALQLAQVEFERLGK